MSFKNTDIGKIPVEWDVKMIQEIGEVVSGGTPKTKEDSYWDGNISWITPKDLSSFTERYIEVGERSITELGLKNSSAKLLPKGTVLFSSRAPIGYLAIARKELCTNQGFKNIVCDKKYSSNEFLFYMLKAKKNKIESIAGGSTFKEVSGKVVKEFKIPIPPLNEQKAIAHILSTLDDKIEVNNQINKTLENMAQAIFKQWFVDFEFPNEDGEPYKPSGGEMVETELGMIPKGWEVGTLNDIGEIIGGGTPSKSKIHYFAENGIPWITPKDLSNNKNKFIDKGALDISEEGLKNSSAKLMPEGSVLFSSRAPIGYIAIAKNQLTTNQGFRSIVPKELYGPEFVYQLLVSNLEKIESRASGSTFKEISGGELKKIEVVLPDAKVINDFNHIVTNMSKLIAINEDSNKELINIRDSLLPKLMSGEIRVPLDEEGDVS